ncbi:MAG TPA: ABC transporter permease subunit [Methylomirabilota bacterium]|jgi:NitT/TauT family transport system permease protein
MADQRSGRQSEAVEAVDVAHVGRWPRETIVSLAAFVVLWHLASLVLPPFVAPSWARIGKSLVDIAARPEFIAITVGRVLIALVLSFVFGVALAMAMYRWNLLERYLMPLMKLLMAVPVLCWILFAVLWFRDREVRIAFILIMVCAPIFLIDVLDGMHGISRDLRDMVRALRPSAPHFFAKLILPATAPAILTSWKVNLSLAIRVVTMAELVGATSGIGYALMQANETFAIADVFAWTVVLVLLLMMAQIVVTRIERRLLVWRD